MEKKEPEHMYTAALKYHASPLEIDLEQVEIDAAVADMSRFSVLYDRYYIRIFRFVLQRVGDEETSADVTSRVFLNAMVHLGSYKHKGYPFASWLYRIARNEVNQYYRRERTDRQFQTQWNDIADVAQEIDKQGEEEHLIKEMMKALKKLKQDDLEIVEMRFFEKRSFREIGDILGMTENNAKVKMFRIIQRLKKIMNV
jgi:RNA polymerase sigma-70 factor (ECF subfamily)